MGSKSPVSSNFNITLYICLASLPKVNATVGFKVTLTPLRSPKSTGEISTYTYMYIILLPRIPPQSQRHRWVQGHPDTPSLPKINATGEFKFPPSKSTQRHPFFFEFNVNLIIDHVCECIYSPSLKTRILFLTMQNNMKKLLIQNRTDEVQNEIFTFCFSFWDRSTGIAWCSMHRFLQHAQRRW